MAFFNKQQNNEYNFHREQSNKDRAMTQGIEANRIGSQDDMTTMNMQEERTDLLKWQQDLDPELQKLIHTLKGETFVNSEWCPRTFWKDGKLFNTRPMCNDKFIQEVVVPQCTPFLDRNIINTWYEEEQILSSLKFTCDDIVDAMCDHYDEYGIEFTDYDIVLRNIKNVIKPGAFRALKGWTKKIDSTIIRRIEQSSDGQEKDKKGIMSVFKS